MKHRIRDSIIFFICLLGLDRTFRRKKSKAGPLVRVLCFHDVADRLWFASILNLLQSKYNLIEPSDIENSNYDKNKINILLTFDDGYQSWVDNCLPELESRGIKALFFVNSGLLECQNETEVENFYKDKVLISTKKPLTWEGARQLLAQGHTIGSHTVNHVRMAKVSLEKAKEEVEKDKAQLEGELGIKIKHFAYPFGTKNDHSEDTIKLVESLGIGYQFSAVTGFMSESDKLNIIPRTLLENDQSLESVGRWIGGGYDIFKAI